MVPLLSLPRERTICADAPQAQRLRASTPLVYEVRATFDGAPEAWRRFWSTLWLEMPGFSLFAEQPPRAHRSSRAQQGEPVNFYLRILAKWATLSLVGFAAACAGPDLGSSPAVCSTHAVDEGESPLMEPGGDCMQCHSEHGGPHFTFAGTVMNAAHDDTNCRGVSDVIVRIKGADGKTFELTTNANGNFYSEVKLSSIAFPYTAEVSRGSKTTAMLTSRTQSETNCANCHTAAGANAAPGRIIAP